MNINKKLLFGCLLLTVCLLILVGPEPAWADALQQGGIPVDVEHAENEIVQIARGVFSILQIVAIFVAIAFGLWQLMQAVRQRNPADGAKAFVLFIMAGFAFSPGTWVRALGMPTLADEISRVIPERASSSTGTTATPQQGPPVRRAEGPYILTLRSTDEEEVKCVGAIEPAESLTYHCKYNLQELEQRGRALPDTIWLEITDEGNVVRVDR